jgi:hypothetical protein
MLLFSFSIFYGFLALFLSYNCYQRFGYCRRREFLVLKFNRRTNVEPCINVQSKPFSPAFGNTLLAVRPSCLYVFCLFILGLSWCVGLVALLHFLIGFVRLVKMQMCYQKRWLNSCHSLRFDFVNVLYCYVVISY